MRSSTKGKTKAAAGGEKKGAAGKSAGGGKGKAPGKSILKGKKGEQPLSDAPLSAGLSQSSDGSL